MDTEKHNFTQWTHYYHTRALHITANFSDPFISYPLSILEGFQKSRRGTSFERDTAMHRVITKLHATKLPFKHCVARIQHTEYNQRRQEPESKVWKSILLFTDHSTPQTLTQWRAISTRYYRSLRLSTCVLFLTALQKGGRYLPTYLIAFRSRRQSLVIVSSSFPTVNFNLI